MPDNASYYFTEKPEAASAEREIEFNFAGLSFNFISDTAVFSKNRIDLGSELLLQALVREMSKLSTSDSSRYEKIYNGKKLDLGCGYGVIGLSAQKLYPGGSLIMSDVNERALGLAKRNVLRNNVSPVKVIKSDGFAEIDGEFELILTNPPIRTGKSKVEELLEACYKHLSTDGLLLTVIGKKQGADSYEKFWESIKANPRKILKKKGFTVYACEQKGNRKI